MAIRPYLAAALVAAAPAGGLAAPADTRVSAQVHVIGNDQGGALRARLAEVQRIRARDERVEIRGQVCHSACTLYLGVRDVCVLPATRFGFHGPVYRDRPIARERFDHWSRAMAAHYPPEIADWFMHTARHVAGGYLVRTGAELIRLGVSRCR